MEREERRAEERIESKRAKLKALFALVFQDFGRYQISLEENVLLGDIRRRDEERLRQYSSGGVGGCGEGASRRHKDASGENKEGGSGAFWRTA